MSTRTRLALSLLTVLTLINPPSPPAPAGAQSAIGQLEQMTGQHINRFQPRGMRAPRGMGGMGGVGGMIGLMVLESVITGAMQGSAAHNARLTGQQAAQRAELEAWLKAEQKRLADMVKQQRAKRDAEDKASMEELSAAMSQKWDGGAPAKDLASALSDPYTVVTNPTGTPFFGLGKGSAQMGDFDSGPSKPTVDLSKATSQAPKIPESQNQVALRQVQMRSQAAKELQRTVKDFQNPRILDQRLQKLEDDLAKALRQADALKNEAMAAVRDYEEYERWLASVSGRTFMQGVGLFLTGVVNLAWDYNEDKMIKAGGATLLDRLTDLRNDPVKWEKNLKALEVISTATLMGRDSINYAVSERQLENALELIADSLARGIPEKYSPHYTLGKSMIKSGLTIGKEIEIMGEMRAAEGTTQAYLAKQKQLEIQIKSLVKAIKERRQQLALNQGVGR